MTRPDFSPAMLRFFLRARLPALQLGGHADADRVAQRAAKETLRRAAGLTRRELQQAFLGTLTGAEARTRLWAVLGHFPADFAIVLTDDGGQQRA